MKKTINYSAKCPFCDTYHHHAEPLTTPDGHPLATGYHHFNCCGHEFGFSVRQTLAAYMSEKGQVMA